MRPSAHLPKCAKSRFDEHWRIDERLDSKIFFAAMSLRMASCRITHVER